MSPRRPARIPGFSYVGFYRYSLRFCTNGRSRIFESSATVTAALAQIRRAAHEERFGLLAYCFMPDHVHLIVEGIEDSSDLRRFVKIAKQRFVRRLRTEAGIAAVWQEGYYERVLRSDETTDTVVRYVLDNPVRAGIVTKAEHYQHSGAMFWPEGW
jgi:putative transposase